MQKLILPDRTAPTNLRLRSTARVRYIDNDLYDIASRIKALHPSLYILEASEGDQCVWIIMESCQDGVERLVFKVEELDGRVIRRLNEIMSMDLHQRIDKLEKLAYKAEQDRQDEAFEKFYETAGRPMWTQLEHDGFIQRPVSYPKVGVAKPGKAR